MIGKEMHTKALGADSFRSSIRSYVYGFWKGQYDTNGFVHGMVQAIDRYLHMAWYEGASACGIKQGDLTADEIYKLEQEIFSQYQYIFGLAQDISINSKKNKGKLGPLYQRAEMWVNKYDMVKSMAQMLACGDKKLKWRMGATREHCRDCLRLEGRVYRASVWKRYNIQPRMHSLSCRGYKCQCYFEITNEPVTPGRPPNIGGG